MEGAVKYINIVFVALTVNIRYDFQFNIFQNTTCNTVIMATRTLKLKLLLLFIAVVAISELKAHPLRCWPKSVNGTLIIEEYCTVSENVDLLKNRQYYYWG